MKEVAKVLIERVTPEVKYSKEDAVIADFVTSDNEKRDKCIGEANKETLNEELKNPQRVSKIKLFALSALMLSEGKRGYDYSLEMPKFWEESLNEIEKEWVAIFKEIEKEVNSLIGMCAEFSGEYMWIPERIDAYEQLFMKIDTLNPAEQQLIIRLHALGFLRNQITKRHLQDISI